jgi:AbrB family looped-hinge helix DNA binding protein
MHVVGQKGQVVIQKEIRDKLSIEPGWLTIQRLVDGHVEIYFVPPEHNRSLKGILARPNQPTIAPEDWHAAKEAALEEAIKADWSGAQR